MGARVSQLIATIPNGTAVSNGFQLHDHNSIILTTPAAWTAAVLTFDVSLDGVTWYPLYDDAAAEVSIASATIGASRAIAAATILNKVLGATWVRLRSGAAGAPVNQGAARAFGVILKSV
jgi:hypothetical protein